MSKKFETIDEYLTKDPSVSARHAKLNGLIATELTEQSNEISVGHVPMNSVLVAISKADSYRMKFADVSTTTPRRAGDVSLIPSGCSIQSAWTVNGYALETFALEFTDLMFRTYTPEIYTETFAAGHLRPKVTTQQTEIACLSLLLRREMFSTESRGKLFLDSTIRLFAMEIAASVWTTAAAKPCHGTQADTRIARALDFIEANYCSDISLLDIAQAAGCSLSLLTDKFERQTGKTPYSYVIDRRIRRAEELLLEDHMPIAQVALHAGFGDQQHLTRVMRARLGKTPRMVRFGLADRNVKLPLVSLQRLSQLLDRE